MRLFLLGILLVCWCSGVTFSQTLAQSSPSVNASDIDEEDILVEEGEDPPQQEQSSPPHQAPSTEPNSEQSTSDTVGSEQFEPAPSVAPAQVEEVKTLADSVDETRAINFAENLKGYRSPRLAMLMSLVVPGLGQAYAKQYWKTGLFLGLEAAIIGVSASFVQKGRAVDRQVRAHVDSTYDLERFNARLEELRAGVRNSRQGFTEDSVRSFVYSIFAGQDTLLNQEAKNKRSGRFYDLLEYDYFVWGWKDCYPRHDLSLLNDNNQVDVPEREMGDTLIFTVAALGGLAYKVQRRLSNGTVIDDLAQYGFSDHYETYRSLVTTRRKQYNIAYGMLYALLANHIASAIDAGISAKRYNDRLLNSDQTSMWERIDVQHIFVDSGSETVPGIAMTVRF